jgi:hypothetical protein
VIEAPDRRNDKESDDEASDGVDRDAFASACEALGLTAALLPARLDDDRSEDGTADMAARLHAERAALLAAEDVLTAAEREVLQPLLATFKANYVPWPMH